MHGEKGEGDSMVYVRLRVKDCIPPSCNFPIYRWTSLESTASGAREKGWERMQFTKRVCPGLAPIETMSGSNSYYWGRGGQW